MYDIITRMPLIVWAPRRFEGGRKLDGLCQQMDIAPAILELAGASVPETMEARSLMPALRGESWNGRDYMFAEHPRDGILQEINFMTMVRSKEWKLVHFLDEPSAASKKHELSHALLEWHIRSQYHTRDWAGEWR